jgi:SAM-dependent methyltransferase
VNSHLAGSAASAWVERFAGQVPAGPVLDLACGGGRHSALFARLGHPVWAADKSLEAVTQVQSLGLAGITALQADFELPLPAARAQANWPLQVGRWAGIVVSNYLHRPLFPELFASLAEGGVLIYETFALGNERHGKPSNPAFLLVPGELQALTAAAGPGLHVLAYEDGTITAPRAARVQRICVARRADGGELNLN